MTAILALDLGTKTGYAFSPSAGALISGVWNLKGGRYEGGGMRFLRFRRFLDELHASTPIEHVAFEEVRRHAGTDAAHVYGGLMGQLTAWCEAPTNGGAAIPYEGVPVGTIKRHVTGKGNAGKSAVIAAVEALGYAPADDNEADAIALALLKREEIGV